MIKSFKNKRLKKFFETGEASRIQKRHVKRLALVLDVIDYAETIKDLNFPGSGLHKLEPKRDERWALKISGNWRVTFVFMDGEASDVDYMDYH